MAMRHRRTPSVPLRVRTASISQRSDFDDASSPPPFQDILSPSSADIPSALPAASPDATPGEGSLSSSKSSEKYGFVVYAGSLVAWWIYIVWAFIPDRYLKAAGLEWYPSREWAILVPAWIMMAVVYVYVAYFALNLYHTPRLTDLSTITDTQANILPKGWDQSGLLSDLSDDSIPPLYDLPPGLVSRAVFG